jgi:hypothetical protein
MALTQCDAPKFRRYTVARKIERGTTAPGSHEAWKQRQTSCIEVDDALGMAEQWKFDKDEGLHRLGRCYPAKRACLDDSDVTSYRSPAGLSGDRQVNWRV